jgi:hypothetical protein
MDVFSQVHSLPLNLSVRHYRVPSSTTSDRQVGWGDRIVFQDPVGHEVIFWRKGYFKMNLGSKLLDGSTGEKLSHHMSSKDRDDYN